MRIQYDVGWTKQTEDKGKGSSHGDVSGIESGHMNTNAVFKTRMELFFCLHNEMDRVQDICDIFCFFFHWTRLADLWSRCYGSFRHGHATVHGSFLIMQDQRAVGAFLKVIRTLEEKVD